MHNLRFFLCITLSLSSCINYYNELIESHKEYCKEQIFFITISEKNSKEYITNLYGFLSLDVINKRHFSVVYLTNFPLEIEYNYQITLLSIMFLFYFFRKLVDIFHKNVGQQREIYDKTALNNLHNIFNQYTNFS